MGRPSKSVNVISKRLTKEERETRLNAEEKIKGEADKLAPPKHLTRGQTKAFKFIVQELEKSNILGNIDIFILTQAAICIDRLSEMEQEINRDPELLKSNAYMSSKDKYSKDFFRCCSELCLSPQSRAKIAIAAVKPQGKKSIIDLLRDDSDD